MTLEEKIRRLIVELEGRADRCDDYWAGFQNDFVSGEEADTIAAELREVVLPKLRALVEH